MRGPLALLLVVVVLTHCALAHICILDPPQRGALNVSDPGDDSCYRRTPYCGGIPAGPVSATYYPGQEIAVMFQQNLNHWYPQKPGYFDLAISYNAIVNPINATWITLARMPDFPAHDMVWQTNFTFLAHLPHEECDNCVLRARYVSNNPDEIDPSNNTEAIFYNCADVKISYRAPKPKKASSSFSSFSAKKKSGNSASVAATQAPRSCCTPPEWTAQASDGENEIMIWYSATLKFVRIDRMNSKGTYLSTITNYANSTNVPEYVNFAEQDICMTYGGDAFYEWCYGLPANQLVYYNESMSVWSNEEFGGHMRWVTDDQCLPLSWSMENQFSWTFHVFNTTVSPSVFDVPADCNHPANSGCGRKVA